MFKNILFILLGKIALFFIKIFSLGAGSTWPGEVVLRLNPDFIREILNNNPIKVIIVAGTNGKTTTASLLKKIIEDQGEKVIHNQEGANLLNGIVSSLVKNISLAGKLNYQFAIFEVDENTLPLFLKTYTPQVLIILNLFRDQLDRYGEVNTIAYKWHQGLKKLPGSIKVFLNADDPQVKYLGSGLKAGVYYFGLDKRKMKKSELTHDVDSIYCPRCATKLKYRLVSYSHLGDYWCDNCSFNREIPQTIADWAINPKIKGRYNQYNITAAALVSQKIFSFSKKNIIKSIENFSPAFGRQEVIKIKKRKIVVLLSKNPAGFNQSIEAAGEIVSGKKSNLLLILNDRVPDGRDVSWIWDVDFENIFKFTNLLFISGDRAFDLALRIFYAGFPKTKIEFVSENIKKAVHQIIAKTAPTSQIIILATYSAMLEVRQALLGKKFL